MYFTEWITASLGSTVGDAIEGQSGPSVLTASSIVAMQQTRSKSNVPWVLCFANISFKRMVAVGQEPVSGAALFGITIRLKKGKRRLQGQ